MKLRNRLNETKGKYYMLLPALLLLCTGCWDRKELNDVVFPLTSSIDLEQDGKIRIAAEFPIVSQLGGEGGQGGGGGGKPYFVDSDSARTLREAWAKLQTRMPRHINPSHRRITVVGEAFARNGIRPIFEATGRLPEARLNGFMVITKGKGSELIKANSPLENLAAEPLRELVKQLSGSKSNLKNLAVALSTDTIDPIIAYVGPIPSEQDSGKPTIGLLGYAQFRDDKMVGSYTGDKVEGISLLTNNVNTHILTIEKEDKALVSIQIKRGETEITPKPGTGTDISFDIKAKVVGNLVEESSNTDSSTSTDIMKLEEALSLKIKSCIMMTLKDMQAKQTDSVKLGNMVRNRHPKAWKARYKADWRQILKKATFNVTVKSELDTTGVTSGNIAGRNQNW